MVKNSQSTGPMSNVSMHVMGGGGFLGMAPEAPVQRVRPDWQKWVAENVLLGRSPESIVKAMTENGHDFGTATAEVRTAMSHPYLEAARQIGASATGPLLDNKLKKRDWVLEIYRRTQRMSAEASTVSRVHKPSRQEFLDKYYSQNRPVIIEGAMNDWPAMTQWTPDNLKLRFGDRVVEVQANREKDTLYEVNQDKLRQQMRFGDFVDITESAGQTNNWYMTANNSGMNKQALRELWDDIILFPDYLRGDDPNNRGFFWFGPAGTVTPLHHDLTNNFMAQVRGRKLIRLVAPYELPYVYNHRHCYSKVDLDRIDEQQFPQFKDARVIDVIIGPGELFFLPVGWWHYVRGLDISITMTFTNFVFDNDFSSFYSTFSEI